MQNALRDQCGKILRSQGKGEEVRKTASFFTVGGLSKASFSCPLSFSRFLRLVALILGLRHQRGKGAGGQRKK